MNKIFYIAFVFLLLIGTTFAQDKNIDVQNYSIDLDLSNNFKGPLNYAFDAKTVIKVKALSDISSLSINAIEHSLQINSVSGAATSFSHFDDILNINLDRVYTFNEEFEISISYAHKNLFDTAIYAGKGIMYTDCEPEGARSWFPCKDFPDDKATFEIKAKVPANVLFGSNGLLIDSTSDGIFTNYTWKTDLQTATYLAVFVASNDYKLREITWEVPGTRQVIPVRFYYQSTDDVKKLDLMISRVPKMLDYFSGVFGNYPFEKLGLATVDSHFPWGGMENQTLITLCPNCWTDDLLAHEIAHQWFGDLISPSQWSDIWLNEGFATYSETIWAESTDGIGKYKALNKYNADSYLITNPHRAIYNRSWDTLLPSNDTLFNVAMTYNKSGAILYMLRYVLGDDMFFRFVKSYATDPNLMFKNISTNEFVKLVSEYAGKDMTWFFDQWLYRPNHPIYNNKYQIIEEDNGWKVKFKITQTQREGFFKMPIEIQVNSGKSVQFFKFNNDYNNQVFEIKLKDEPDDVIFDPNDGIILKIARTAQGF